VAFDQGPRHHERLEYVLRLRCPLGHHQHSDPDPERPYGATQCWVSAQ
jgi:hypothetical protein